MFEMMALSSGSAQASAGKAALSWDETPANSDGQNTTEKRKNMADFFLFCQQFCALGKSPKL